MSPPTYWELSKACCWWCGPTKRGNNGFKAGEDMNCCTMCGVLCCLPWSCTAHASGMRAAAETSDRGENLSNASCAWYWIPFYGCWTIGSEYQSLRETQEEPSDSACSETCQGCLCCPCAYLWNFNTYGNMMARGEIEKADVSSCGMPFCCWEKNKKKEGNPYTSFFKRMCADTNDGATPCFFCCLCCGGSTNAGPAPPTPGGNEEEPQRIASQFAPERNLSSFAPDDKPNATPERIPSAMA